MILKGSRIAIRIGNSEAAVRVGGSQRCAGGYQGGLGWSMKGLGGLENRLNGEK